MKYTLTPWKESTNVLPRLLVERDFGLPTSMADESHFGSYRRSISLPSEKQRQLQPPSKHFQQPLCFHGVSANLQLLQQRIRFLLPHTGTGLSPFANHHSHA